MYFISCPSGHYDLHSPSGHSSLSILVYGALGTIIARALSGVRRLAAILATAALVAIVAVSRSILGAHTATEIAVGLAVGGAALAPFIHLYLRVPVARISRAQLLAALAVLPFAFTVESPDTEKILGRIAAHLQQIAPMCDQADRTGDPVQ